MIAVLTDPAVGGTFLTWSLHYLSGHTEYFHANNSCYNDLPLSPLGTYNAHKFKPNQPTSAESFDKILTKLIDTQTDKFHTIYFHNFNYSLNTIDASQINAIKKLAKYVDKIIVVSTSANSKLYNCSHIPRDNCRRSWKHQDVRLTQPSEMLNEFIDVFFAESKKTWYSQGLTSPWDQREFIALNFKFDEVFCIEPNIDSSIDYYSIDTQDLYNTFDTSIYNLFAYLEITIDKSRWKKWVAIYNKWKVVHYQRLQFIWYFDKIINYTIGGRNFDLTKFNLDIVQEAAIQHNLIYKHNINLKTWQLEKFTNTKQLHQLLEPNIHKIS